MDKFLCVLGIYDEDTQQVLREHQEAVLGMGLTGRQTMGIPFHVTLGTFGTDRRQELEEKLHRLEMGPFEVYFNHIGMFEGQQVLFLAPDVDRELLTLKEAFSDERGWTAHTTLLIDDRENALRAVELLGKRFRRFTGRIERVGLYEFFPAVKLEEKDLCAGAPCLCEGGAMERLQAFEQMLSDVKKQSEYELEQMEKLKTAGKEKSATYRQYFGNRMQYKMILEKYREYELLK